MVVLKVPWGYGPPALSPCSGSEVRVLLFNATGDRDTAALLKLLVVRFGGHGGVTVPGCLDSLPVLGPILLWVQGAARWSWHPVCSVRLLLTVVGLLLACTSEQK